MKWRDLALKILNGEDLPTFKEDAFYVKYNRSRHCFEYFRDKKFTDYYACKFEIRFEELNNEVEVIEEEKKIEKLDISEMMKKKKWKRDRRTWQKINEIIDKLNEEQTNDND